jgi:hypothetical protein
MKSDENIFVTKQDLQTAFTDFEKKITEQHEKQHETRIQMISGHYSDVLNSNKQLKESVCAAHKALESKLDNLIEKVQPTLEVQEGLGFIQKIFKMLGIPFAALFLFIYWIFKQL